MNRLLVLIEKLIGCRFFWLLIRANADGIGLRQTSAPVFWSRFLAYVFYIIDIKNYRR